MKSPKIFILNGQQMESTEAFWDEIQRVLCPKFAKFGRNFDAFIDILRGGFNSYEFGEEIIIRLKNRNYAFKKIGNTIGKAIDIMNNAENVDLII